MKIVAENCSKFIQNYFLDVGHKVVYLFDVLHFLEWKSLYFDRSPIDNKTYRQTYSISRTLVGNKIVDHSDVVGASPVGAAPNASSFSTYLAAMDNCKAGRETSNLLWFGATYIRGLNVIRYVLV